MSANAIQYYGKRFGSDVPKTFIHITREIGELARAIESNNTDLAKVEITETAALLFFLADKYGLNLMENMEAIYKKKLEKTQSPA